MISEKNDYAIQGTGVIGRLLAPLLAVSMLVAIFSPAPSHAIAGWSAKYKVNCRTCHTSVFARLNYDGEKFLWNGYQDPDNEEPDGNKVGKKQIGDNLSIEDVRNWLQIRLNVSPVEVTTNGQVIRKSTGTGPATLDTVPKISIGNTGWMQLFVAGSISKNISIYIENEFTPSAFKIEWYYMGFHNLAGTKLLNFQVGRISPTLLFPFPDRLPQLPGLVGDPGVLRVKSSNGKGAASVDIRSSRYGVQYYGYAGPAMVFGGVSPGPSAAYAGELSGLGYWAGLRLFMPEGEGPLQKLLEGSSLGYEYMTGTDLKGTNVETENKYRRHMPGVNLRLGENLDIQGSYVIGIDDNWMLDSAAAAKRDLSYQGIRALGTYALGDHWAVSGQWDNYWSDNQALLAEERRLSAPIVTYFPRENIRVSLYPVYDLRDVGDKLKKHQLLANIRVGF